MNTETKVDVVIVGAGIGGATLALALARKGIGVTILEQVSEFKPIYKGEYLQPKSLEILTALGVAEELREATHPVYLNLITDETGTVLVDMDLRELGPFEGRNGHHRMIQGVVLNALKACPNVSLRMGQRLTSLRREGATWHLETTGGTLQTKLVVGADGRQSAVRKLLGIAANESTYPGASLAVTIDLDHEADPRLVQAFGSGDSAFFFPLPNKQARLYLVLTEDADYAAFKAQPDGGLAAYKGRLSAYFPSLAANIDRIDSLKAVQVIPAHYLLAHRWVVDGAALIGDAAHCVNPSRGQGMNLAIGDAWELVGLIEAGLDKGDLSATALAPYEERRRPIARYIHQDSDLNRRIFLSRSPMAAWLRAKVLRNSPRAKRAMRRLMATFAGLQDPPKPLEGMLINAAMIAPVLDRLVPD